MENYRKRVITTLHYTFYIILYISVLFLKCKQNTRKKEDFIVKKYKIIHFYNKHHPSIEFFYIYLRTILLYLRSFITY